MALRKIPGGRATAAVSADPDVKAVPRDSVVAQLRDLASGWKQGYEKTLNMPGQLYSFQEGTLLAFSSDERMRALDFLPSMRSGGAPPGGIDAYGLIVYETSSSAYFLLVDTGRGILVKGQIASFHSGEKEDWGRFMGSVEKALGLARPGKIAVVDTVLGISETY
ncbi:MAG: hypothetical protein U0R44_04425 [Candidatus Micrarchaeia archaeon]